MGMFTAIGTGAGFLIGGPSGAAIGGSIGASLDSSSAQREANKTNRAISESQMKFQERMSNSAHQRQVADMRAAGLNPMLAAGMGGSSSPSGAAATMQSEDPQMQQVVSTALETKRLAQDLANAKATEKQIKQQTKKTQTETTLLKANAPTAKLKHTLGNMAVKEVESMSSTAKATRSNLTDWRHHLQNNLQTTTRASRNKYKGKTYKESQASRDAFDSKIRKLKRENPGRKNFPTY